MNTLAAFGLAVNHSMDEEHFSYGSPSRFEFHARLYGKLDGHPVLLGEEANPYDLFCNVRNNKNLEAIAFVATGWSAPYTSDDGILPSEHNERVRIIINVAYDGSETVTHLRRMDAPNRDELIDGNGTGPLADALEEWWNS